ncbi:glycosyltransferase [Salinisphaera sp.]|uniref:glycosyltransferase n=1 Tax=Salinisphaera sp. TaxID=1914330 RepID=UPI002D777C5E|nr:glycosyltransferase [Salinisphaera sp.]HET7312781.1 glycosyltransferase [Salinisphaera sp.]
MPLQCAPPLVICIPVRDETRRLPALIQALAEQRDGAPFGVCLLFDGPQPDCRDRAIEQARAARLTLYHDSIARQKRSNAGRARRAAMALGLATLGDAADGLILTTDADCRPAPDWVAANRAALAEVDIVAGHIRREPLPAHRRRDRLERYLERLYTLERTLDPITYEPPPGHPSIGGASLGFRASVYRALGGFATLAAGEDTDLVQTARRLGFWVRRDHQVRVETSSRLFGRARGGLADELRRSKYAPSASERVERPAEVAARYEACAAARRAFTGDSRAYGFLADRCAVGIRELHALVHESPSADAFALLIESRWPAARRIDLVTAEAELARLLPYPLGGADNEAV